MTPVVTPGGPAPVLGPGSGDGGWAARLERWAGEARVDAAAASRAREHSLRRQAEEDATVAGVLVDLAEAAIPVRVHLRSGGTVSGTIRAVGVDVVAVEHGGPDGALSLVALGAVASVRTGAGARAVAGDRAVVSTLRLVDVLAGVAGERASVLVHTDDGAAVAGEARGLGRDVLVVRTGGHRGAGGFDPTSGVAYVPLAAITAVEL